MISWLPICGKCRFCRDGQYMHCANRIRHDDAIAYGEVGLAVHGDDLPHPFVAQSFASVT